MNKAASILIATALIFSQGAHKLSADASEHSEKEFIKKPAAPTQTPKATFEAFTGKILRNKVRMRVQPNLDGQIVRELNRDDMIVVDGETEDFYIIRPLKDMKAYIFRTFVLDNIIEGNRVNVRLEPDLSATVIAQLNSGDRVNGTVSAQDKKWLEIPVPSSAQFYIAKEYIDKIGDGNLMAVLEKRRENINTLLKNTQDAIQVELSKPYEQMGIEGISQNLNKIMGQSKDFPDQAIKAKELFAYLQESYLRKKVAYMERQVQASKTQTIQIASPHPSTITAGDADTQNFSANAINSKMTAWLPAEQALFGKWLLQHPGKSIEEFYEQQAEEAVLLQGVLEPYDRTIKSKPGNFVLLNRSTNLPVAYLYSTSLNLQDKVGHEVTIKGASRGNNNFAFPAFYVLTIE